MSWSLPLLPLPSQSDLLSAPLVVFQSAESRLYWAYLALSLTVLTFVFSLGNTKRKVLSTRWLTHASMRVDAALLILGSLLRAMMAPVLVFLSVLLATTLAKGIALTFPQFRITQAPSVWMLTTYGTLFFLVDDLSRYALHRMMHKSKWLFSVHRTHHTATVMTPLTFHRLHPLEVALLGLRHTLVVGVLGGVLLSLFRGNVGLEVPLVYLVLHGIFHATSANLRHSHLFWGFGRAAEHVLISPAQHQLHHSRSHTAQNKNFGSVLAIWDWLFGTLNVSTGQAQPRFGLLQSERPAPKSLLRALLPLGTLPRKPKLPPHSATRVLDPN